MQTVIKQSYNHSLKPSFGINAIWKRFIKWTNEQEKNRLGWTAFIITGHGCLFTIATVMAIVFTGNQFIYWPFAIVSMAACLITNLAAMPTRITIPVFFASLLIDIVILALCLSQGFNMELTYV